MCIVSSQLLLSCRQDTIAAEANVLRVKQLLLEQKDAPITHILKACIKSLRITHCDKLLESCFASELHCRTRCVEEGWGCLTVWLLGRHSRSELDRGDPRRPC